MSITREARYLSGNDVGKTATIHYPRTETGVIAALRFQYSEVSITLHECSGNRDFVFHMDNDHLVDLTGTEETK